MVNADALNWLASRVRVLEKRLLQLEQQEVHKIDAKYGNNLDFTKIEDSPEHSTTDFPQHDAPDFQEHGATDFPQNGATEFPEHGVTDFPQNGAADFSQHGAADFSERDAADFPEHGATDFPQHGATDFPQHDAADSPQHDAADFPQHDAADSPAPDPVPPPAGAADSVHPALLNMFSHVSTQIGALSTNLCEQATATQTALKTQAETLKDTNDTVEKLAIRLASLEVDLGHLCGDDGDDDYWDD